MHKANEFIWQKYLIHVVLCRALPAFGSWVTVLGKLGRVQRSSKAGSVFH